MILIYDVLILLEQQRNTLNFNNVAVAVILFSSICFTMKQLHQSTVIHNNSGGGLLKQILQELATTNILYLCPRGIKNSSRSTSVYIKQLPDENDVEDEQDFLFKLSEYKFNNKPITMEMYRQSCEKVILDAVGVVQDDVYEILRQPEYGNRDLSVLTMLKTTRSPKSTGSMISILDNHNGKCVNKLIRKKSHFVSDFISTGDLNQNEYFNFEQELGVVCCIF